MGDWHIRRGWGALADRVTDALVAVGCALLGAARAVGRAVARALRGRRRDSAPVARRLTPAEIEAFQRAWLAQWEAYAREDKGSHGRA